MDSQAPNRVAAEWLRLHFGAGAEIRPETKYEHSRLYFCVKSEGYVTFVEVKGCTLERDGIALFPDAPTEGEPGTFMNWPAALRRGNAVQWRFL